MNYKNLREIFEDIDRLKRHARSLTRTNLRIFKTEFYMLPLQNWQLNLIWEYFWDDIIYEELYNILWERYH